MKKQIFRNAWSWFKADLFTSFAESLRAAWSRYKLQTVLRRGVAYFTYIKSDGTERQAVGTLNPMNFTYSAKTTARTTPSSLIRYWDLEKRAFRSMRIDRFVGFN